MRKWCIAGAIAGTGEINKCQEREFVHYKSEIYYIRTKLGTPS
jgi:hypothetical protein